MRRRDFLLSAAAAGAGLLASPMCQAVAGQPRQQKLLYFTRCVGSGHSAVIRKNGELALSERVLNQLGQQNGFDVTCTKDGSVFENDLDHFDAVAFYTSGDMSKPDDPGRPVNGGAPPMTPKGRQCLLDMIRAGKIGFVGLHSAWWDPHVQIIGAQFHGHGRQQEAELRNVAPGFPGMQSVPASFRLMEEWYSMASFAKDLHVILVQETAGMNGKFYQRPPYPATWARMLGKGRIYYTSLGHRDDTWNKPLFTQIVLGGLLWAMHRIDADVTPNIESVTPGAWNNSATQ